MACYPSVTAHSFDILIPIVAHYALPDAPTPLFTIDFLHRCHYTAVAPNLNLRKRKAWYIAATALELANMAPSAPHAMEYDGTWIWPLGLVCRMDGWRITYLLDTICDGVAQRGR